MVTNQRLLIISPVRNEKKHIEHTIRSMIAQTRPPDLWLVIDDGSDDLTLEILRGFERDISFLRLLAVPRVPTNGSDRLALALEAKAFNRGLAEVEANSFTHIGKLDGDIELPGDYFEKLLREFDADPSLGIAGGLIEETTGRNGSWRITRAPSSHVQGALRLYSRECFETVGGVRVTLGWDVIDQVYARMSGFRTFSYPNLVARHHRVAGSASGRLRGRMRDGRCTYIARYSFTWVLMRSIKLSVERRPYGISGIAFVCGYLLCMAQRAERVEDEEFKRFVRREHRGRVLRRLGIQTEHSSVRAAARKRDPVRFVG